LTIATTIITLVYRGSLPALYGFLNQLPLLAQASAALQVRLGQALLYNIRTAFLVKARGGTDASGLRWKPLAPLTIALRRRGPRATGSIEILRDTGLLFNSLQAGAPGAGATAPVAVPYQVFRTGRREVIIGTRRPWAWAHHVGLPERRPPLPQRRLWPEVAFWPGNWWRDLLEQGQQGIVDIILQRLSRGP
jgi:hypothetical protein